MSAGKWSLQLLQDSANLQLDSQIRDVPVDTCIVGMVLAAISSLAHQAYISAYY